MVVSFGQKLKCDAVTGATAYDFSLRNAAGGTELGLVTKSEPECPAEDLLGGKSPGTYTFCVRGRNPLSPGTYSALVEITLQALAAPGNPRVE